MKLERVDCYGMEMWIVTGEPLPPPQRGTHCFQDRYRYTAPADACFNFNFKRESAAYRWSRGES